MRIYPMLLPLSDPPDGYSPPPRSLLSLLLFLFQVVLNLLAILLNTHSIVLLVKNRALHINLRVFHVRTSRKKSPLDKLSSLPHSELFCQSPNRVSDLHRDRDLPRSCAFLPVGTGNLHCVIRSHVQLRFSQPQ